MRAAVTLVLCALLITLAWYIPNRPVDPAPGIAVGRFNSLSFEPFRPGQSPLADSFASEAEADADMALIAPLTRAVRTYAAIEGTSDTAAIAARHGVKVWQGIWLGGDRAQNAREIAKGVALARRYKDTIERVVVGNEVLLRRDLPAAELAADIDIVKRQVSQPVAYGDVWEFWQQFPEIARHVDVVLVHLLPYWEDVPTGIDRAVGHVGDVYRRMRALFPDKQVAIGESGWPSRGRERRDAVPSRVNEARFLREFMALGRREGFDYNFIEAFDQDWKYASEGIVGANWGVFSDDRHLKIAPSGPVVENPAWPRHAGFSVLCGILLAGMGLAATPRPRRSAALVLLAMGLGAALGYAQQINDGVLYDVHVRLAAIVNLAGQAMLAVLAMGQAAGAVPRRPERAGVDATRRARELFRGRIGGLDGALEDLIFLFVWTAALLQLLLVFDPRYREFPLGSFAVPLLLVARRLVAGEYTSRPGREEAFLGLVLATAAIASAVQEGPLNGQSLVWNACALLLAAPMLLPFRAARGRAAAIPS